MEEKCDKCRGTGKNFISDCDKCGGTGYVRIEVKQETMIKDKRYRVEVVEIQSGKIVHVIGKNLTEKQADRRIETGISRFNIDKVYIHSVEEK